MHGILCTLTPCRSIIGSQNARLGSKGLFSPLTGTFGTNLWSVVWISALIRIAVGPRLKSVQ